MELIDIGVNLANKAFQHDLDAVLARAQAAGVVQMVVTGVNAAASRTALELTRRYPGTLYATAGVHPHASKDWQAETATELRALAAESTVVALGEMGLDFNRNYSPPPAQERALIAQLELAAELQLPVFLHERDAHRSLLTLLERFRGRLGPVVLHCFTGSGEELAAYLDLDLHIGVTGWICDERRGLHLRELIGRVPLSRLMLETDAPYLLPRDLQPTPRDRRNEPAFLPQVLNAVAACLELPPGAVAEATTRTARTFFGLAG